MNQVLYHQVKLVRRHFLMIFIFLEFSYRQCNNNNSKIFNQSKVDFISFEHNECFGGFIYQQLKQLLSSYKSVFITIRQIGRTGEKNKIEIFNKFPPSESLDLKSAATGVVLFFLNRFRKYIRFLLFLVIIIFIKKYFRELRQQQFQFFKI